MNKKINYPSTRKNQNLLAIGRRYMKNIKALKHGDFQQRIQAGGAMHAEQNDVKEVA